MSLIEPSPDEPDVDAALLRAHLGYAVWARRKTLALLDRLPPDEVERTVESSYESILATLQHVFRADRYYFTRMRGDAPEAASETPESYDELKRAWSALFDEMEAWGRDGLAERRNVVLRGWGVWPCWLALMQLVSHGTHHLGQVLTLARQAGLRPTPDDFTDLIFYYVQRFPQDGQIDWKTTFGMKE